MQPLGVRLRWCRTEPRERTGSRDAAFLTPLSCKVTRSSGPVVCRAPGVTRARPTMGAEA